MNQQTLHIHSPAFNHEQPIPSKYTCDGENLSPPLAIENIPRGAVSLALIMEDPDVPTTIREDGMWNHWVLFNIPPTTSRIGEGDTPQATAGTTTSGTNEYQGPCPPLGQHRYFFKVYALDTSLRLETGASKEAVLEAMHGHIIATSELMGTYKKQQ
jgi:Raf kinase inhibitor-like YbhB/YbcL family protein